MNLRRLRYFLVVAEQKHFGRAAEMLHISQPPLSRQISVLEKELGMSLLTRTTRRVELTEAGAALFHALRGAVHQLDTAIAYAKLAATGQGGVLRVGFVSTAADLIARALLHFRKRHREATIECFHMTSREQVAALQNRTIDAALIRSVPLQDNIDWTVVCRERLFAALPSQHRLSRSSRVTVSHLANEPFVMWASTGGVAATVMSLCRKHGFDPHVALTVINPQTLLSLVAGGMGVSIVPESALHMKKGGVVYKPLPDRDAYADLMLAWRSDNDRELLKRFASAISDITDPAAIHGRSRISRTKER